MNDTSPEVEAMVREMMMQRTGEERFVMGALMFDAARELIIASSPPDLPPLEFKHKLFERIYGCSIESLLSPAGNEELQTEPGRNNKENSACEVKGLQDD